MTSKVEKGNQILWRFLELKTILESKIKDEHQNSKHNCLMGSYKQKVYRKEFSRVKVKINF